MKLKKEYIILAFVIIALSVYLVVRKTNRTLYRLPEVTKVAQKEITRLQVTKGDTAIVFNKKDNTWYIAPEDYPADGNRVKDMLETIENFTLTALVAESKNYSRYDLNEALRVNVKAWQKDQLKRNIDIGKTASSFRHTFVKLEGDERVFHARGNFKNKFDLKKDDFRDKNVLAFKSSDIHFLQLTDKEQVSTFNKQQVPVEVKAPGTEEEKEKKDTSSSPPEPKTSWQAADGQPIDEPELNRFLNSIANLRCESFIDKSKKEDFTSPLITLQLKGAKEYSLSVFDKLEEKDTNYPATSSVSDYPFLLSGSQADRIMKAHTKILKKTKEVKEKTETEEGKSNSQKE